jgi:hypothetical protein
MFLVQGSGRDRAEGPAFNDISTIAPGFSSTFKAHWTRAAELTKPMP